MRRVISTVLFVLLCTILLTAVLAVIIPGAAGYKCYAIIGGSMEPSVKKGSLVYAKQIDPAYLSAGDIVVISDGSGAFTHRLMKNDTLGRLLYTKGDANVFEDVQPSKYDYCVGKVSKALPYAGYVYSFFSSVWGLSTVAALLAAWIILEAILYKRRKTVQRLEPEKGGGT